MGINCLQATLGNARWSSYLRSQPLRQPIKDPSNSGSGVVDPSQYHDTGDLIDTLELKSADVIEASSSEQSVQGRMATRKPWWFNNLQPSALVFGILLNCCMIPFVDLPPPSGYLKNNRSALNNAEFVVTAIKEL